MEKFIWILWFLTIYYLKQTSCDHGCYYYQTQHGTINCFNVTLNDFKKYQKHFYQNALTQIKITHSKVAHLVAGVFINGWPRNMSRTILSDSLRVLDLSHNRVEIIEVNAFYGLKNVVTLNLEHNHLQSVNPEVFDDLKNSLIILNLAHNQLTYINGTLLTNFLNLRCLYLNNNKIHQIFTNQPHLLSVRIEELNLHQNCLQEFPMSVLKLLYKIQKLNLSHNQLNKFNYIFLNDSKINYTFDFYPLSELRELYVNNNDLIDFNIDKLRYLKHLQYAQIQNNQFTCARHEEILKEFINFHVNVTLTNDLMYSPFVCVEHQPQTNDNRSTFFQRHKSDIQMIIEFTLAALVVLIPVVIIVYIVKFIFFRIDDNDDLELRPFQ